MTRADSSRRPFAGTPADPDGTHIASLAFARTEGCIANHSAPDGTPSAEILATQADRLANRRTLQEPARAT